MPRAIIYSVDVHHNTTRHFDVPRPFLPLIKAGFPGIGEDKIKVVPTCVVQEFNLLTAWQDALRTFTQASITIFGGNDPEVVPPAFEQGMMLAEAEAEKLDAARAAAKSSPQAQAEKAAAERAATQAAIGANPEAPVGTPAGTQPPALAPVPSAFD